MRGCSRTEQYKRPELYDHTELDNRTEQYNEERRLPEWGTAVLCLALRSPCRRTDDDIRLLQAFQILGGLFQLFPF